MGALPQPGAGPGAGAGAAFRRAGVAAGAGAGAGAGGVVLSCDTVSAGGGVAGLEGGGGGGGGCWAVSGTHTHCPLFVETTIIVGSFSGCVCAGRGSYLRRPAQG